MLMAIGTRTLRRQPVPGKPRPVLTNRSFLLLWLAQLISQSAQNAILFTLLVIVTKLTKGSTFTSLLVLSFVVPSIVFGIFSGVIVDLWSKRLLLIYTNLARMLLAVLLPPLARPRRPAHPHQRLLRHGEPVLRDDGRCHGAVCRAKGSAHRREQSCSASPSLARSSPA